MNFELYRVIVSVNEIAHPYMDAVVQCEWILVSQSSYYAVV